MAKVNNRTSQMSAEMQKEVLDIARLALLKSRNNDNDIARYIQQVNIFKSLTLKSSTDLTVLSNSTVVFNSSVLMTGLFSGVDEGI